MIIGSGNIASALKDRSDLVFFASGTSNSSCDDSLEFLREHEMLYSIPSFCHVVYFSNLGVFYKKDPYTDHKIKMEEFVKKRFKNYTIIRMEVCEWVKNPTTILNVFKRKIKNGDQIEIIDTYRYVLSLDEFLYWIDRIPSNRSVEINIFGRKMHVSEILEEIKKGKL